MGLLRVSCVGLLLVSWGCGAVTEAQETSGSCGKVPVVAADARPNFFSVEQEAWLGQAYRDHLEHEYVIVKNPAMNAHLQMIVDRLVANLPEPHVAYHAVLIEDAEVNGFSIAGGGIYITRKLAATVKDDDELAGVLGHEIGHIASHQFVFQNTADLKRLLHVTSVTDSKDVYLKFQALLDAWVRENKPSHANDDVKQDEADRISVHLIAAAGYRPAAFAEWWDRVFAVNGKTGGVFSDFFNETTMDQKRLRGMRQTATSLPVGCVARIPDAAEVVAFQQWQKMVIENRMKTVGDSSMVAHDVKLNPPLQMEINRVRFSPDGKLLLAQDEASVYVVTTDTMKLKLTADAEDADSAWFSPDSLRVTFTTPGLHTEEWSVADGKMVAAHEPLAKDACVESRLSPDGRTVICLSFDREWFGELNDTRLLNLSLLDSTTGQVLWEKKPFFEPTLKWAIEAWKRTGSPTERLWASFSSDGNFLLIGPGAQKVGIDLRTRTPVKLGGALRDMVTGPYAFVGSDRVAGEAFDDAKNSGIYSFPDGKKLQKLTFSLPELISVAEPGDKNLVVTPQIPPKDKKQEQTDVKVHLADLSANVSLLASRSFGLDVWKNDFATEGPDGSIFLGKMDDADGKMARQVPLGHSTLGRLQDVAASPDGKWLAYSTRDRSGVWELKSGRQVTLQHPFSSVRWGEEGVLYAEFPKSTEYEHKIVEFNLLTKKDRELNVKLDDDTGMRFGYLTQLKKSAVSRNMQLTVYRLKDNSVAWTRTFPDARPKIAVSFGGVDFILAFPMSSSTAKDAVASEPSLMAEAAALKSSDRIRLVQVVDAETGTIVAQTVVEVPRDYSGVSGVDFGKNMLFVGGNNYRTLVYSAGSGKMVWQTFGRVVAIDPVSGMSCVVNRSDELTLYDSAGKELQHMRTETPVRYAEFLHGAKQLIVLMANQTVRTVDVAPETAVAEK